VFKRPRQFVHVKSSLFSCAYHILSSWGARISGRYSGDPRPIGLFLRPVCNRAKERPDSSNELSSDGRQRLFLCESVDPNETARNGKDIDALYPYQPVLLHVVSPSQAPLPTAIVVVWTGIGTAGLGPAASATQTRRSDRLSYVPRGGQRKDPGPLRERSGANSRAGGVCRTTG
jgi:hypothetical protein